MAGYRTCFSKVCASDCSFTVSGVVQVPGLQVEILPKIDILTLGTAVNDERAQHQARRNLLYMLAVSGDVPAGRVTSMCSITLEWTRASASSSARCVFIETCNKSQNGRRWTTNSKRSFAKACSLRRVQTRVASEPEARHERGRRPGCQCR